MAQCEASAERIPLTPGGQAMSYLPSAHVVDRWTCHWWVSLTHRLHRHLDRRHADGDPHAPRPAADHRGAACRGSGRSSSTRSSRRASRSPSALSEPERAELRARLGFDRVEHLGGGAARCRSTSLRYFDALGLPIAEMWGMSETAGAATSNPRGRHPLTDVRHGAAGSRAAARRTTASCSSAGRSSMRGYRDDPAATATVIDDEGWLHTGDVAHIDDDGYVSIVDRKKELIITAGGKNLSPANIEVELVGASPLIAHAAAIGDRRPYVVALIVLDPDAAVDFAAEHGIDDASVAALSGEPALRQAVRAAIDCRQRAPLEGRAHQALRDPARRMGRRGRGAHADAEAQARRRSRCATRPRSTSSTRRGPGASRPAKQPVR